MGCAIRALRFSLPFKFSSRSYLLAGKATAAIPFSLLRFLLLSKELLHLINPCWSSYIIGCNELASYFLPANPVRRVTINIFKILPLSLILISMK